MSAMSSYLPSWAAARRASDSPRTDSAAQGNGESGIVLAIRKGNRDLVNQLLQSGKIDLLAKDDQGLTPVDHAVLSGDREILASLLTHQLGESVKDAKAQVEDRQSSQLSLQFEKQIEKWKHFDFSHLSDLHQAAFNGDLKKLKDYAAAKTDLNRSSLQGMTPLHCAVLAGKKDAVAFLLQEGANAELLTRDHESVLHFAALSPDPELLNCFLQTKLDANGANKEGFTPLHFAMAHEQLVNARQLIQNGANPLCQSKNGLTPLALLVSSVHRRAGERDPMKIDLMQTLMFAGIVCSWRASLFSRPDPYLLTTASTLLAQYIPFGMLVLNYNSKYKAAALLSEAILSRIPFVGAAYRAFKTGYAAKTRSMVCLCWRNIGLEKLRPLRNGMMNAVNFTRSTMALIEMAAPTVRFVSQPGMLSRMQNFIPSCLQTNTSRNTCFNEFHELETIRSEQGIRWELGAEKIEERFKTFSPICSQELQSREKCESLFWSLEKQRYLQESKWENYFTANLAGRSDRRNLFDKEAKATGKEWNFEAIFDLVEQNRYLKGIRWEDNFKGMADRYKEFKSTCDSMKEPDQSCSNRFLGLEEKRWFNRILWEMQFPGALDRWKTFEPVAIQSMRPNYLAIQESAENYFLISKRPVILKKQIGKQTGKRALTIAASDWSSLLPHAKSLGLPRKNAHLKFAPFESDRMIQQTTQDVAFDGMADRWRLLESSAPLLSLDQQQTKNLFWFLEKIRANQNIKWEETLARVKERSQVFLPSCQKSLNGIELRNAKRCEGLFKVSELSRLDTSDPSEEKLKENAETIGQRWQHFNGQCSTMPINSHSCEQLFWDTIEPMLWSSGIKMENVENLSADWKSFQEACKDQNACESSFGKLV